MDLIVSFPASRVSKSHGSEDGPKTKKRVHFTDNVDEGRADKIVLTDDIKIDVWYTSREMKSFRAQMIMDARKIAQYSSIINLAEVDKVVSIPSSLHIDCLGLENFLNPSTLRKHRDMCKSFFDDFFQNTKKSIF